MHVYCWLSNLSIKQHPRIGNCILEFDEFLHHYKQRWKQSMYTKIQSVFLGMQISNVMQGTPVRLGHVDEDGMLAASETGQIGRASCRERV